MRVFFFIFFLFASIFLSAQQRCGTVEYEKMRNVKQLKETKEQFEQWMQNMLIKKQQPGKADRTEGTTLVVPIVVHIIHNGEAIGTGTNIPDAQVQSQIDVINKDFQRLNADANKTPSEFTGVAGSMDVQFVLAKQDPDGLATTGIVRAEGTQTSWTLSDDRTLKALSYWPSENYLNIWVVNLSGGFLGYTQLPVSNTLLGLDQSSNDRLTDGVVVHYKSFGTADGGNFDLLTRYNKGRTATHEIGHYFGLRHIWGDDSNCATDYVDDTPFQSSSTNGCPTGVMVSCGGDNMYQNYLDYTDDGCMNIFTQGQVARMNIVTQNSPRRASLKNSVGALAPAPVANDLGIKSILNPGSTACGGSIAPSLLIRNYGTNNITSAKIQFSLNGSVVSTQTFTLSLAATSETTISFPSVTVNESNSYNFDFKVLQINGGADGNAANDELSTSTSIPVSVTLPYTQSFNSTPSNWSIDNPSGVNAWENISVSATNKAMYLNFYNNENLDTYSRLVSPVLDLTTETTATLSFDHAYVMYPDVTNERLRVIVYQDCSYDATSVEVYNKAGSNLATAPQATSSFVPTTSQWVTSFISLNAFLGKKIQIAFEGTNGYGNNLYLDNVAILNYPFTAFELSDLASPSPVSCQSTIAPIIAVKNLGNTTITSMEANIYVNNGAGIKQSVTGISILPGAIQNITLNPISLSNGNNNLSIAIRKPNGVAINAQGDSITFVRNINSSTDHIPLRENFNESFLGRWSLISPQSGQNWFLAQTNYSLSLIFNSYSNTKIGEQAWLVSPVLDFSNKQKASLFFDTSYGKRATGSDKLEVYASEDCGETFSKLLFSASGSDLANTNSDASWTPTTSSDWLKSYINLDNFAGEKNVRFAFIATNDNGNNLYLDNIEFYEDDNSLQPSVENPYKIYGGIDTPVKITFNLYDRDDVRVQVYSIQGMVVTDQNLSDVLNQTFTIDIPNGSTGVYIVRLQIGNSISSAKVWVGF